jgi:hypothetical protein
MSRTSSDLPEDSSLSPLINQQLISLQDFHQFLLKDPIKTIISDFQRIKVA